ncbi:LysM domain-containing protein [Billgrantia gudaonensis]|uniref:LysM domain-containing protein n=1 Tax=Billgrantia gudaonensis TaxID=376427 RepID=A0A3S0NXK7_9GAMM|nr:LysM domain-containing protein [Halomonas gudaonensis]
MKVRRHQYVVQRGDTLSRIARHHGVSVDELRRQSLQATSSGRPESRYAGAGNLAYR